MPWPRRTAEGLRGSGQRFEQVLAVLAEPDLAAATSQPHALGHSGARGRTHELRAATARHRHPLRLPRPSLWPAPDPSCRTTAHLHVGARGYRPHRPRSAGAAAVHGPGRDAGRDRGHRHHRGGDRRAREGRSVAMRTPLPRDPGATICRAFVAVSARDADGVRSKLPEARSVSVAPRR